MSIKLAPGETRQMDIILTPISPWMLPTGHISPDPNWYYPQNAYDGNLDTASRL